MSIGTLYLEVQEARDLIAANSNGTSDPYCLISVAGQKIKTAVAKHTLNPKFDKHLSINIDDPYEKLLVEVYSNNTFSKDAFLGQIELRLASFVNGEEVEKWFRLHEKLATGDRLTLPSAATASALTPRGSSSATQRALVLKICEKLSFSLSYSSVELANLLVKEQLEANLLQPEVVFEEKKLRGTIDQILNVLAEMNVISKEQNELKWIQDGQTLNADELVASVSARLNPIVVTLVPALPDLPLTPRPEPSFSASPVPQLSPRPSPSPTASSSSSVSTTPFPAALDTHSTTETASLTSNLLTTTAEILNENIIANQKDAIHRPSDPRIFRGFLYMKVLFHAHEKLLFPKALLASALANANTAPAPIDGHPLTPRVSPSSSSTAATVSTPTVPTAATTTSEAKSNVVTPIAGTTVTISSSSSGLRRLYDVFKKSDSSGSLPSEGEQQQAQSQDSADASTSESGSKIRNLFKKQGTSLQETLTRVSSFGKKTAEQPTDVPVSGAEGKASAQVSLEAFQDRRSSLSPRPSDHMDLSAETRNYIESLKESLKKSKGKVNILKKAIQDAEAENNKLQSENEALKMLREDYERMKKQMEEYENTKKLVHENEDLRMRLASATAHVEQLQAAITTLTLPVSSPIPSPRAPNSSHLDPHSAPERRAGSSEPISVEKLQSELRTVQEDRRVLSADVAKYKKLYERTQAALDELSKRQQSLKPSPTAERVTKPAAVSQETRELQQRFMISSSELLVESFDCSLGRVHVFTQHVCFEPSKLHTLITPARDISFLISSISTITKSKSFIPFPSLSLGISTRDGQDVELGGFTRRDECVDSIVKQARKLDHHIQVKEK